ncbi:MAG: hypothetical protein CMN30_00360 [Sandaracinus sp.]|nr:hypothetical protein [Sandaracinus sp.]
MIRVNLLPQAKRQVRTASSPSERGTTGWVAAYLGAALVTGIACAVWYVSLGNELEAQRRQNNELQQRIDALRQESASLEEVQAKLQASLALAEVVEQLDAARSGPTRVLMEISNILSTGPGSGPTIDPEKLEEMRRENPLAGFNRNWDPRRLSLDSFTEENGQAKVTGSGRTNEDVAEFLRRLALSEVFEEVLLERTQARDVDGIELIGFEIATKVVY